MYQIMVIDDEVEILYGVQFLVDWSALGFTLSKLCSSSEEAILFLKTTSIDLVITDIRMPRIDGLALAAYIRETSPDTCIIALSGYDDFDYVKTAFQVGVSDYLLKPLDDKALAEALQKARRSLDARTAGKERLAMTEHDYEAALQAQHYKVFSHMLSGSRSILQKNEQQMLDVLDCRKYRLLLVRPAHSPSAETAETPGTDTMYKTIFLRLQNTHHLCFHTLREENTLFLLEDFPALPAEIQRIFHTEKLTNASCAAFSLAVSPQLRSLSELKEAYAQTKQRLIHDIFFNDPGALYFYKSFAPVPAAHSDIPEASAYEEPLRKAILETKDGALHAFFQSVALSLRQRQQKLSVSAGIEFWRSLSDACLSALKDIFRISREAADDFTCGCEWIPQFYSMNQIVYHLEVLIASAISNTESHALQDTGTTVSLICFYLRNHALEDISLVQVAQAFYLNPSYLSRLFREKTGNTFWSYVTELRLEKAKEMLRCTTEPLETIGFACGFQNSKSFYGAFKKRFGCTPGKYRKLGEKGDDSGMPPF